MKCEINVGILKKKKKIVYIKICKITLQVTLQKNTFEQNKKGFDLSLFRFSLLIFLREKKYYPFLY